MNTLYITMGQRIAKLRHDNHLTQFQLAELLDISDKHCSEVERGLSCLSLEKLICLCDILSTDLDYIIRGKEHRNDAESNVPLFVINMCNSSDDKEKELLNEYLSLFKKCITVHNLLLNFYKQTTGFLKKRYTVLSIPAS